MKKFNKKGFTIVELVIVIAVIAILAGVLIPTFSGMVQKAQESAALQNARNRYTEYVGMHDYSDGTSPEQNLVIEVGSEYVIVVDAKMVDKVYEGKNKELAKADAKYDEDTPAYFLCEEHENVIKDADDKLTDTLCDDCGLCINHKDEINNETNAAVKDKLCDVCGKCETHDWTDTPVATGVCKVCYAECEHDFKNDAGDDLAACEICGKAK